MGCQGAKPISLYIDMNQDEFIDARVKIPKHINIQTASRQELEEKCRQLLKEEYKYQSLKFEFYNNRTKKIIRSRHGISDEWDTKDCILAHVKVQAPDMVRLRFGTNTKGRVRQSFHQDEKMIQVKKHFIENQKITIAEDMITMYFNDLEIDDENETLKYYNIKREGDISFRYEKDRNRELDSSWRTIRSGLIFEGKCLNHHCFAFRQLVTQNKGLGTFDLHYDIIGFMECPVCNQQIEEIESFGFVSWVVDFNGETESGVKYDKTKAYKSSTSERFKKGRTIAWKTLTIHVRPRERSII